MARIFPPPIHPRGNGDERTGWVNFPTDLEPDAMGCAVYAIVPEGPWGEDPFVRGLGLTPVSLDEGDGVGPEYAALFIAPDGHSAPNSGSMLAAVCLGTCGRSYTKADGTAWFATRDDLNPHGTMLCLTLERLYERPVQLITLVDT